MGQNIATIQEVTSRLEFNILMTMSKFVLFLRHTSLPGFQPQKENFGFDVLSLFLASPLRTYIAWKLAEMRSRGGRTRNRDVCFGVKTVANFGMEKKKGKMRWFVQWLPS
ncbi:hypothetical protein M9H77_14843 [Catharanthus roseus]|uniref:Uncharacterized protein n=1 Tax=Catharanthus roseus TaxID=4058 RepID=A0ACC0BP65_CATRO|nr:hypothetical protein M9H77_14843 [Catharanthus roseus]